ncbi:hypothetical protein L915_03793 [Phytophthora nicotianae]|uniref:Uncharacterized protein n=1 Tax=Phytophthora nicotianae TaxID=4792 RepID=W2HEG9_PHYNI|nr:hypothetical protein L915_03793 [Phytophthora nicotianae]ETL46379.1 hypothetical protein L916_03732 [Phytophthora nicotianae]
MVFLTRSSHHGLMGFADASHGLERTAGYDVKHTAGHAV